MVIENELIVHVIFFVSIVAFLRGAAFLFDFVRNGSKYPPPSLQQLKCLFYSFKPFFREIKNR